MWKSYLDPVPNKTILDDTFWKKKKWRRKFESGLGAGLWSGMIVNFGRCDNAMVTVLQKYKSLN